MEQKEKFSTFVASFYIRPFTHGLRSTILLLISSLASYTITDKKIFFVTAGFAVIYVFLTIIEVCTKKGKFEYVSIALGSLWKRIIAGALLGVGLAGLVWWAGRMLDRMVNTTGDIASLRNLSLVVILIAVAAINSAEDFILEKVEKEHKEQESEEEKNDGEHRDISEEDGPVKRPPCS